MDDLDLGATIKGFSPGQKVFNRYTLKKILGRGGMGVVWLAHDGELERDVALKFLPEVVAMDKQSILELKRETRRSLELTHPHIVRIHDFVQDGRTAAISMEYVAGDSLAALKVDQPGHCYSPDQLAKWVRQLCEALDYAHQKAEVVHRDLKPANLMVDARGDLKIADFGIAASVSDSVSRVSAQAGSSGTPVYMSPQQMMGEKPAVTDDIYALGATLYDLLTGKPPFHSGNVMMQVQNKVPPTMTARRQEFEVSGAPIPAAWEETVAACLAKEPAERPQGARDVARRLGLTSSPTTAPFPVQPAATKPAPVSDRPAPSPATPAVAKTQATKSKVPLFVGLTVAVLVLAGVGYYFGVHAPEQKRLAEMKRLEDQGRAAEAAKLRNEKEKSDAAAKEKADAEQQAYAIMVAKIDALLDGSPVTQREATEKAVKEYLASVPARFKADIEGRWTRRVAGWEAHRLNLARGGFRIRTNPEGAEVQIGSLALEKSPVVKNDVRLGKYPVTVRADGYEDYRGEIEVKENDFADPGVITLARSTGTLRVASVPAGLTVSIDGVKQTTPVEMKGVPTGEHVIVFQRPGWADVRQNVTIGRNQTHQAEANFIGGSLEIDSTPAKAEVWAKGNRLGFTPLKLEDQPPGAVAFEVRHEGYLKEKRTVEFVPGRKAENWQADLKPGGYLDGRPKFEDGPKALRAKLTSTTSGAAQAVMTIESNFELGPAGRNGMWNQISERVISCSSSYGAQYNYTEGTTFQYSQSPDGGWTGKTISGGWPGGAYKPAEFDKYLQPFLALIWVMPAEFWPTGEMKEGGTWPVPITGRADFLGKVAGAKGVMTGQLKKVTEGHALIDYSFDLQAQNLNANLAFEFKGTMQIRVNLLDKYVEWGKVQFSQNGQSMKFETTLESEVLSITPR